MVAVRLFPLGRPWDHPCQDHPYQVVAHHDHPWALPYQVRPYQVASRLVVRLVLPGGDLRGKRLVGVLP